VTNADDPLKVTQFSKNDERLDVVKAFQLFGSGGTFVIRDVHKRIENFALLCREVERHCSSPAKANLYLTPSNGRGFEAHYDTHDVLLLQLQGRKEWKIFDAPVELPLAGQGVNTSVHPIGALQLAITLDEGDTLYIPRGYMHEGRCCEEASLHATLGITAIRWSDVVMEAVGQLCLDDSSFAITHPLAMSVDL